MQTRSAQQLGPYLERMGQRPIYLLEPWLDNIMHLQQFMLLYHDLPNSRVNRLNMKRDAAQPWFERQTRNPGARSILLDWDDEEGLVPARELPSSRHSSQGQARTADTGVRSPVVRMMMITP